MRSLGLKRVVMRTSVGCAPPVKGCTDTSRRPLLRSNPAGDTQVHAGVCNAAARDALANTVYPAFRHDHS